MRTGFGKESTDARRGTAWNDGLYSVDGTRSGNGSFTSSESPSTGAGGSGRGGEDAVSQTTWFDPIEEISDCPGGVCPVPWAKAVDLLGNSEFLTQDRDSNFPGENTIEFTRQGPPVIQEDLVNHPSHYTDGGIECIEAIESALTNEEYRGFLKGNVLKYIWRERHKGETESLKKARWYLDCLIELDEVQKG